jgi:hypothetical protein
MMGFKAFHSAQATIAGIETAHMIRKGQLSEENIPASVTLFPLIYLVQYLLGLGVVTLSVDTLNWDKALAPLASIALTVPITFFLSHLVFSQSSLPKEKVNEG